ncbi:hypothetical protein JCM10207_004984 [Rhodosporidiobolus poonsookiae]
MQQPSRPPLALGGGRDPWPFKGAALFPLTPVSNESFSSSSSSSSSSIFSEDEDPVDAAMDRRESLSALPGDSASPVSLPSAKM